MLCGGCRYVYMDEMLLAVRASPASKVATLSRDSQALLHSVRASLDKSLAGDTDVRSSGWFWCPKPGLSSELNRHDYMHEC